MHSNSAKCSEIAYMTETGLILGQEKIHEKTNEIPTFQQMLEILNVKGKIITADAMHCQRETCKKITQKDGDYVLTLKKNQPELFEDVKFYFDSENVESFATLEKNHGRIEKRICRKMTHIDWLKERHNWSGLKSVFAVERIISTPKKTTRETSYYEVVFIVKSGKMTVWKREKNIKQILRINSGQKLNHCLSE